MGLMGAAFAFFQDTETSTGNTLTAGTFDLNVANVVNCQTKNNYEVENLKENNISDDYKLSKISVFPNPFNNLTSITYSLNNTSEVEIHVYDMIGNKLKTIINKRMNIGNHKIEFSRNGLVPGIYILKLKISDNEYIKRLVVSD